MTFLIIKLVRAFFPDVAQAVLQDIVSVAMGNETVAEVVEGIRSGIEDLGLEVPEELSDGITGVLESVF